MTCHRCRGDMVHVRGVTCGMWVCLRCGNITSDRLQAALEISADGQCDNDKQRFSKLIETEREAQ